MGNFCKQQYRKIYFGNIKSGSAEKAVTLPHLQVRLEVAAACRCPRLDSPNLRMMKSTRLMEPSRRWIESPAKALLGRLKSSEGTKRLWNKIKQGWGLKKGQLCVMCNLVYWNWMFIYYYFLCCHVSVCANLSFCHAITGIWV